jgi:dipeptidyl aminopeptidase/acylaminoacyl peptidase
MRTVAPYGSWKSPISAEMVARVGWWRFSTIKPTPGGIYWAESRPQEGGRSVIRMKAEGTEPRDFTPPTFNARTQVHEYGGGAFCVHDSACFFSSWDDQRLYRQDGAGDAPRPITPEPHIPKGARYADGVVTPDGRYLICVRELHGEGEHVNELVAIATDGAEEPRVVHSGHDFYSFPRVGPGGDYLAWTTWDHPRMPWDGSELWVAPLSSDASLGERRRVAGGPSESIFQPEWGPEGALYFVSDRSDWWNLYRERDGAVEPVAPMEAEVGVPQWLFGFSRYDFLSGGRLVAAYFKEGTDRLALIDPETNAVDVLDVPHTTIDYVRALGDDVFYVGGSPTQVASVVRLNVTSGEVETLEAGSKDPVDEDYISMAEPVEFPTADGLTAHALYYRPRNPDYAAPSDEKPPLSVLVHGGPTACVTSELNYYIQFWTSRGFAVLDVNYGGSTGYGRKYRERLNGTWGLVDTVDAINAAKFLVDKGEVDPNRMTIAGGSAGGWTTLCALTFHDVFAAGANYYGVSDLMGFVDDTHKFESRYIHTLVGPWPEAKDLWYERSPINFVDRLSAPVIVMQGLDDEVVPPSQSEIVVEALREKKIPYVYLAFEGEQHGFRRAENIKRAHEAELYFYSKIFGFEVSDEIEPIEIANLT